MSAKSFSARLMRATAIGSAVALAITAALLHCLNHGFFKGGLFLAAGSVQHAAGTREMDQLGGLAPRTQAEFVLHHLKAGTEPAEVGDGLRAMARRRSGLRQ